MTVAPLPLYPSTRARKSLSPSESAILSQKIASALSQILELPPDKRDIASTRDFISSYAKDNALVALESLIWGTPQAVQSREEKAIRQRTLLVADKLASTTNQSAALDPQSLLDLSIVFSPTNPTRVRALFSTAVSANKSLLSRIEREAVPAFTTLLSPVNGTVASGLYGIRKASHCLRCLLLPSPPEVLRLFAFDKPFMLALANAYDQGLSSIATLYGGFDLSDQENTDQTIFVETKVALMDCFNTLVSKVFIGDSITNGTPDIDKVFDILFELVELAPSSSTNSTPYLNRPLITDYQDSYDLSKIIATGLKKARSEDARFDLLESQLHAIAPTSGGKKQPGALKLLLHSSGVPLVGIDLKGKGKAHPAAVSTEPLPSAPTEDLDLKVTQVLDIFPDQPTDYIRALLEHPDYSFKGNPERVIEALLEGTAPPPEDLRHAPVHEEVYVAEEAKAEEFIYTQGRRNVFDNEVVDVDSSRVGKKRDDAESLLKDRSFIEQMKADILRRVEEISDDEAEEEEEQGGFEDVIDGVGGVKVVGDGEESEEDEEGGEGRPSKANPETICELAYIRDPKLFDRDGQTRRSKARADLKAETGWADEQLEGWRIMLERNPKKDKVLEKHEFAGNKPGPVPSTSGSNQPPGRGRGTGGRGRGRGRGAARGGGDDAKERAWKDKNKASRGNHNRKRGHDKKMARGGPPPT